MLKPIKSAVKNSLTIILGLFICLLFACNSKPPAPAQEKAVVVIRFALDTAGKITDELVLKQLTDLAAHIDSTADRIVLTGYTEKRSTKEEELRLATEQATAAKQVMLDTKLERIYYNVGIDAKGYENPVDEKNPGAIINRRIEIVMP